MTKQQYFWKKRTLVYFLAALLVIFIHSSVVEQYSAVPADTLTGIAGFLKNLFAYGIGGMAVPLFFMLSGLTFFRNYKNSLYPQKIKSRFWALVIPFLIWNVIGMFFIIVCTYTPIANFISGRELFEPSLQNVLGGIFLYKYNYVFWFIYNLIIFTLLAPIFDFLLSRKWLGVATMVGALILPLFFSQQMAVVGLNASSLVFYLVGAFVGKHYFKIASQPQSVQVSWAGLGICIGAVLIKMLTIYGVVAVPQIVQQLILVAFCIALWLAMDLAVGKIKQTDFMQESFLIYALHPYIIAIIAKVIYVVAPKNSLMMLVNFVVSYILTILLLKGIIMVWKKFLPKSYRICSGQLSQHKAKMC